MVQFQKLHVKISLLCIWCVKTEWTHNGSDVKFEHVYILILLHVAPVTKKCLNCLAEELPLVQHVYVTH